jgi:hypothetical protein
MNYHDYNAITEGRKRIRRAMAWMQFASYCAGRDWPALFMSASWIRQRASEARYMKATDGRRVSP